MDHGEKACWLALLSSEDVDRATAKRALYHLAVVEQRQLTDCADLSASELVETLTDVDLAEAARWQAALAGASAAAEELRRWKDQGLDLITRADPSYPENLAQRLPEGWLPYVLFYRGDLSLLSRPAVYVAGAETITQDAARLVHDLAESLVTLPLVLSGGYAQGVDRQALTDASSLGLPTTLMLPVGFGHAGPIMRAGQSAIEAGTRLELSPYPYDAVYAPALGRARTRLTTVLSEVLILVNPAEPAQDWPGVADQAEHGGAVLWWQSGDGMVDGGWRELGALPFREAAQASQLIVRQLGLGEDDSVPDQAVEPLPGQAPAAAVHFQNATSAIDQLARTGRVPEKLMRRLRDAERQGNLGDDDQP